MPTYLFAWNPRRWAWASIAGDARAAARDGALVLGWGCGGTRGIGPGDRAFLIRLGREPKGIVGAGIVISAPYATAHFEPTRALRGDLTWEVEIRFDSLLDPASAPPLSRDFLRHTPPLSAMHWDTRMSGVRIPDAVAAALEVAWAGHLGRPVPDDE